MTKRKPKTETAPRAAPKPRRRALGKGAANYGLPEAFANKFADLAAAQEPLGEPFQAILQRSLDELYAREEEPARIDLATQYALWESMLQDYRPGMNP